MVLRKYTRGTIILRTTRSCLFNLLITALSCYLVVACRGTHARDAEVPQDCLSQGQINRNQINYIRTSVQRYFQWEAYWTYNDQANRAAYIEQLSQRVPIQIFNLRRGLLVFVPDLGNSVLTFNKSPGGSISSVNIVKRGALLDGSFDGDKLISVAKALGSWREFLAFTGKESDTEPYRTPLLIPEDQMRSYIERNRASIEFCETESEIDLLPLEPPTYDPMDKRKESLLERIVNTSIESAKTMFRKGSSVTITIPNFNIDDGGIWVLLEDSGEAYTVAMDIDEQNSAVTYINTVEIRSNPKYGISLGADEKIRTVAIKKLKYKVQ